jgi:hypothetical protein
MHVSPFGGKPVTGPADWQRRALFDTGHGGKPCAVTDVDGPRACTLGLGDDRTFSRDSLERSLLDVAVRAARRRDCENLDRVPVLGRHAGLSGLVRRGALIGDAWADAVPADFADLVDADAVAAWIAGRYPDGAYPGVVLGSPHGGAVHLAAALGVPWLPTGFTLNVHWPEGTAGDWEGALEAGVHFAEQLLAVNPNVTVRQVHDPVRRGVLAGSTITLHVRWRRLPPAYLELLGRRLAPDAGALVLRDTRTWPVLGLGSGYSFQVGSPRNGWHPREYTTSNPSFAALLRQLDDDPWTPLDPQLPRRFAELAGDVQMEAEIRDLLPESHRILYPSPGVLSACVADLYRDWLRRSGRGGDHCVVETERLLDPWLVLAAGLVPYWCESASVAAVDGAESWLAGSSWFAEVDVLPQPPGTVCDAHAGPAQWRSPSWFAGSTGMVDREAMRRYPMLPLPTGHATAVLRSRTPAEALPLPPLTMAAVVPALRHSGDQLGMLVA